SVVSSLSAAAVSKAISRDSITQGPAIRKKGWSSPISTPHSFMSASFFRRRTRRATARPGAVIAMCLRLRLGFALLLMSQCGLDVADEQRVAVARCGSEFGVELHAHEPGMLRQLHDLRQLLGGRAGADHHAGLFEARDIHVVDFVAMAMAFVDFRTVDFSGASTWLNGTALRALAHGATQVGIIVTTLNLAFAILPFGNERNDRVGCSGI